MLTLGACAPLPERAARPLPDARAREQAIAALERYELHGRVAIRTATDGYSATLHWIQTGAEYALRLSGPLGGGTTTLRGDAEGVELLSANHDPVRARDPEALMQQILGYRLPVAGLRYWTLGIAAPGAPVDARRTDADGRLIELAQSGWRMTFENYAPAGAHELPGRVNLSSGSVRVRLAVTRWALE
jgi:outer membrane lipoprotein LolB